MYSDEAVKITSLEHGFIIWTLDTYCLPIKVLIMGTKE